MPTKSIDHTVLVGLFWVALIPPVGVNSGWEPGEETRAPTFPGDTVQGQESRSAGGLEAAMLSGLEWRGVGPALMSGRVSDVAVATTAGAPDAIYVGAASGGLFRSTNQGISWEPLFDGMEGLISVGDVAVAPSNRNLVWVGTGEPNNRQSSAWGEGVYRSLDGGRSWEHMGLRDTRHIGRIVIHPADPDIVYVAAAGHLWGPNEERGVFRTTDGGRTWEKVLYVDENTGAIDLAMDPRDPQTLFAAMYQRQRRVWGFSGGGPGSGLYRSVDGGATWRELTDGLPQDEMGRIGIDIFQGDSRIVYAIVEADPGPTPRGATYSVPPPTLRTEKGGVFRSVDRGETWEQMSSFNPRPPYFSQIRVDPNDPDRVYVLGVSFVHISDDGGRTFRGSNSGDASIHPDHHALWIDPRDPRHLIDGNDGGVAVSWDRGETWRFIDNLPLGQFYGIAVDMQDPYHICGGLQDNGSWCVPSATRYADGITNFDVYNVGGSDGYQTLIDPLDPTKMFLVSWEGWLTWLDTVSGASQYVTPAPRDRAHAERGGYRWDWNTPIRLSRHDPTTLYMGYDVLLKSTDRGRTWAEISPDLTTGTDRDTLELMGRRVAAETLGQIDGVIFYSSLTAISESPLDPNVLYTGSDDGEVRLTRDGGAHWASLRDGISGLPPFTPVSHLAASHHLEGRVYATFDGHELDDYRPYVFASDDFGETWRSLSATLPETSVNVIREHPRQPGLLFLGHETGVHTSIDGGETWLSLKLNMPSVPVDDLIIHPRDNDLVAGTHGRSIWILDDIGPLEAITPGVLASEAYMFPLRPARLHIPRAREGQFGDDHFVASNPAFGARITYHLGRAYQEDVEITISDAAGNVVRTLSGPARRGLNRLMWDLRIEPPYVPTEADGAEPRGPVVLPGEYSVDLALPQDGDGDDDGQRPNLTELLIVEGDPLVPVSAGERQERQDALLDVYELQKALATSRAAVNALSEQIGQLEDHLDARAEARGVGQQPQDARELVEQLAEKVSRVQREVEHQTRAVQDWRGLVDSIERYAGAPTAGQVRRLDWTFEGVTRIVEELNRILEAELPALYGELGTRGLWPAPAPRILPPARRRQSTP